MLDARVYRGAFLPLVLALFVVAFSLERRPQPATTVLAADAFNGTLAYGMADPPPPTSLRGLARGYPRRAPGGPGDAGVGTRVAETLRASGFQVKRRVARGRPAGGAIESETVIGLRPGVSSRRIVVVADRAASSAPGLAELSGTAALLELARVFRTTEAETSAEAPAGGAPAGSRSIGRDLRRTLVLVSTSGAALGGGGPAARAITEAVGPADDVDAVLVLGNLGGGTVRKPWVVPWSNGSYEAPVGLRRTVEAAVRTEVGAQPGGGHASAQWVRRAFPLTVSAQGEAAAAGLPAVLLQVSGERGPGPGSTVSPERLEEFGRATLRAISAIDGIGAPPPGSSRRAPDETGPAAWEGQTAGIVTVRRVLPDWAVRLLVGAALLPALLGAFDGFFRVRRRRLAVLRWVGWVAGAALPFALAYLWLRILTLTSALGAPAAPVLPGEVPLRGGAIVALASVGLVFGVTWWLVRRTLLGGLRRQADPAAGGAAAAIGLLLAALTLGVWIANPYAAAILVPATHAWLLVSDAGSRMRGAGAVAVLAAGLVLPALVVLHYALALDLGPAGVAWLAVLIAAGGHVTPAAALVLSLFAGCLLAAVAIVRARGRAIDSQPPAEERVVSTRGPLTYAGPGSLGGTESALRR